ncbi:dihydrofolate reductase family protein [Pseudooceanicola sp. C21-150M6]|uniref:dihydrofolate reductase family protein n=1 Tax=Pseudooceanicola sp. C21-150M6 TaxID=3434355 RepID=UPI003D7FE2DC
MREIIYDVTMSSDGFIAPPGADTGPFACRGPHVSAFLDRLPAYRTTIMGRSAYRDVAGDGLPIGENPFPFTDCHIVSTTLALPRNAAVDRISASQVVELKLGTGGPIFLSGGGTLAGWLRRRHLIDRLRLTVDPVWLGGGVPLWGEADGSDLPEGDPIAEHHHPGGVLFREYRLH